MEEKVQGEKRKRKYRQILTVLLAISIASLALLFWKAQMQAPESVFENKVYTLGAAALTYPEAQLDNIKENTNLTNQMTGEAQKSRENMQSDEKKPQDKGAEDEKKPEDEDKESGGETGGKTDSETGEETDSESGGETGEETGEESDPETDSEAGSKFQQEYEDLAEDALVQQDIQVSDLMAEIGLDDPNQIIYVRNITGVGKDSMLQSVNGAYAALLSTKGTTIIQIKYKDAAGSTQLYIKKINYVRPEGSTPAEKQPLIQTNLKDNGIYNQPTLNFDVWVTDYRGKALGYSDMEVMVNGSPADYIGEMNRQTYSTRLKNGSNTITIKITDEYQYTVRKTYTVFYKSGKGRITISLEAGTIGIPYLAEPKEIDVESGVSLSYVLDEYLKSEGFTYSYTGNLEDGFYLSKIHRKDMIKGYKIPADLVAKIKKDELLFDEKGYESLSDLGEFDFCQGSGWMYSINGLYSSYGFNKAYVQDGDVVRIRFTLAYGKDIGGYAAMEGAYGVLESYGKEW